MATIDTHSPLIAVTGAQGWIGARLCGLARERGRAVRALGRKDLETGSLPASLAGCEILVHAAGLAHTGADDAGHERSNVALSEGIGLAARDAGVRRLVFVSSARVMGSRSGRPFRESDAPAPDDGYSRSKLRAERALLGMHAPGRFDVVVVRPPLVYGPGARANFLSLLRAARSRAPLPLADATAPRSMIYLDNLADCLLFLCDSPEAAGRILFTSDGHDTSVNLLVRELRACWGRRPCLFSLPGPLWRLAGLAGPKRAAAVHAARQRIHTAFQLDIAEISALGWQAPVQWQAAIAATASAWAEAPAGRRAGMRLGSPQ